MFSLTVQDQAVRAALTAVAGRVSNLRPVLQDIAEDIVQRAKARFDTSTGPDGQRWKAKKRPDGRPPLVGPSGNLRRQIVPQAAGADQVAIAATMKYAAIQQFGGTVQRAAGQITVRHRTDAKGELLRSAIMGGRGLIFAKAKHKRALQRTFDRKAHVIRIPPRPYLPVRADGSLYPAEQVAILSAIEAWLAGR